MKDLKSFVKTCIAEVVVEPTDEGKLASLAMAGLLGFGALKAAHHTPHHGSSDAKPKIHMADPTKELPGEEHMDSWDLADKYSTNKEKVATGLRPMMKMTKFVKECIAEVIIEPIPRKIKVYGNPRRLQTARLVKECIMEVLKENLLSENLDPQSQGPNIPKENPYPEMNNKMRMMEEKPNEDAWERYEKGYSAGQAHKRSGIKPSGTMSNVESDGYHDALKGKVKSSPDVVRKTVKEIDPHGRYAQEAGATPFQPSVEEYDDHQANEISGREEEKRMKDLRDMTNKVWGNRPDIISHDVDTGGIGFHHHSHPKSPDAGPNPKKNEDAHGHYSKESGATPFQPSVEESHRTHSTEVKWICPHCGQNTIIPVEIESSSDYIACADCEHCGKEISDPRLDQKVYAEVIDFYSGKSTH
jgi:DNA-directed RNA polymerase subunit RPC12/RpoP